MRITRLSLSSLLLRFTMILGQSCCLGLSWDMYWMKKWRRLALLQVICWVLGEYGTVSGSSAGEVMDQLADIPETQTVSDAVRGYMLTAFGKLAAQSGAPLTAAAHEILQSASRSANPDLQQRALELQSLLRYEVRMAASVLPYRGRGTQTPAMRGANNVACCAVFREERSNGRSQVTRRVRISMSTPISAS